MDNTLHLVGIAKKARRVEVGEEPVGAAARARQARLIVLAADAAENTQRRAAHFAEAGNTPWVLCPYTKAELGRAVGRTSCAMLAFTDAGLASSFVGKLAEQDGERYAEVAATLSTKASKVLQRQKEKRQHEKNIQRGKLKPWAMSGKEGAERRLAEKGVSADTGPHKSGDTERKNAPLNRKNKKGPGTGTKRNGGRQVT